MPQIIHIKLKELHPIKKKKNSKICMLLSTEAALELRTLAIAYVLSAQGLQALINITHLLNAA